MTSMFKVVLAISVLTSGCDILPGLRKATDGGPNADGAAPSSRGPAQDGDGSDAVDGSGAATAGGLDVSRRAAGAGGQGSSPGGQGPSSGELPGTSDGGTSAGSATLVASDGGASLWLISGDASAPGVASPTALSTVTFPTGQVISWPTVDSGVPTPLATFTAPQVAAADTTSLVLARDATGSVSSRAGCGEPPSCFLRASISTASGRKYAASLSSAYPEDTCARDLVGENKNVILIGDSYPRTAAGEACSPARPQMTLAFFMPSAVVGRRFLTSDYWLADDGFNSQWHLAGAPGTDSGDYVPEPGLVSRLDLFLSALTSGGEAFGQLSVPLHHSVSGAPALGFVAFDVRIR